MTWGLASSVARMVRSAIAAPAFSASNHPEAISGPAATTATMQSADETRLSLLIAQRAPRVCNRKTDLTRRYIDTNLTLAKGLSSENSNAE